VLGVRDVGAVYPLGELVILHVASLDEPALLVDLLLEFEDGDPSQLNLVGLGGEPLEEGSGIEIRC
jgi:hypothetical protein